MGRTIAGMPAPPDPPRLVNTRLFFMNFSTNKVDEVIHLLSPDVTYTVPGQSSFAGVFQGPAEVRRHLAGFFGSSTVAYDVLKWVDWLVGESHVAAILYLQLQRKEVVYRGRHVFLVETDQNDLLSAITILFENQEDADRFFAG